MPQIYPLANPRFSDCQRHDCAATSVWFWTCRFRPRNSVANNMVATSAHWPQKSAEAKAAHLNRQQEACDTLYSRFLKGTYSLSPGVWQSFVTIRSCNCFVRIVSTYVGNFKEKWHLVNMTFNVSYGRSYVSLQTKSPNYLNSAITEA